MHFTTKDEQWDSFTIINSYNEIEIQNMRMSIRRTFTIEGNRIKIIYKTLGNQDSIIQIPLVLDPWVRYTEEWGGKYIEINYTWIDKLGDKCWCFGQSTF